MGETIQKHETGAQDGAETRWSIGEEVANAVTHGLGTLLAIAALAILITEAALHGTVWHVVAYSVFGASTVLLYSASTLCHSFSRTQAARIFEILDHSAIYVLIAGTYTAFALTLLRSSVGWWLFAAVWTVAVIGILAQSFYLNRWPILTVLAYLAMGWLIVLVWKPLVMVAPPAVLTWIVAGGLAYTAGLPFYALGKRYRWFHAIWHLFVIVGTACHFFAAIALLPVAP
jgi:hemolysin III